MGRKEDIELEVRCFCALLGIPTPLVVIRHMYNYGNAWIGKGRITLNRKHVMKHGWDNVRDTIHHELIHMALPDTIVRGYKMNGERAQRTAHREVWKQMCMRYGVYPYPYTRNRAAKEKKYGKEIAARGSLPDRTELLRVIL